MKIAEYVNTVTVTRANGESGEEGRGRTRIDREEKGTRTSAGEGRRYEDRNDGFDVRYNGSNLALNDREAGVSCERVE